MYAPSSQGAPEMEESGVQQYKQYTLSQGVSRETFLRYHTRSKSAHDDHRLVRLLQILDLLLGQLDVQRAYDLTSALLSPCVRRVPARLLTGELLEVREVRRADDGRGHAGPREDPRERDLRHLHALLLRELLHAVTQ